MPEVTVGLPVAGSNSAEFKTAVRSVFAQTLRDWNLVIILDGASAEVSSLASSIQDQRVSVVTHAKSMGLSEGLNEIAKLASAPVLARLDADDIMLQNRLQRQVEYLKLHPEVDVLASRAITIDDDTNIRGLLPENSIPVTQAGFLKSHCISHPTVMMRTSWAMHHPYDPRYRRAQDKELWLRSQPTTTYAKLEEPLMLYRIERNAQARKQRASAKYDRMLLRENGPQIIGRFATYRRVSESIVKEAVYAVAASLGQDSALYARHHRPLEEGLETTASNALTAISSARVPGWV